MRAIGNPVKALIAGLVAGAGVALGLTAGSVADILRDHPARTVAVLAVTLVLQGLSLDVRGKGSIGTSAIGFLGAGIVLGAGPAMAIGVIAALAQWARRRGLAHRALFDAANFVLSAGAAAGAYEALTDAHSSRGATFAAATVAGLAFATVNSGLLCLVMALSESRSPRAVWLERFHWARFAVLAYGPVAGAAVLIYDEATAGGLIALFVLPVLLLLGMQHALSRRPGLSG